MYDNTFDAEKYAESALVRVGSVIASETNRNNFHDYAVRVYGILPESTMEETKAAFDAFRNHKLAEYHPPPPPNDFDDEFHEASYNMRCALYDVLYWDRVVKENLPVPDGHSRASARQIARTNVFPVLIQWLAVFAPRLEAVAEQFDTGEEADFYISKRAEKKFDVRTISFQAETPNKDVAFEGSRLTALALLNVTEGRIPNLPPDILDELAHATVDEIPEILSIPTIGEALQNGTLKPNEVEKIREKAKASLRAIHSREAAMKPEPKPTTGDRVKDMIAEMRYFDPEEVEKIKAYIGAKQEQLAGVKEIVLRAPEALDTESDE